MTTTDNDFVCDLCTIVFSAAKRHIQDERATRACPIALRRESATVTLCSGGQYVYVLVAFTGMCMTLDCERVSHLHEVA